MNELSIAGTGAEWVVFMLQTKEEASVVVRSRAAQHDLKNFALDRYLRQLLVVGMTSLVRRARTAPGSVDPRIAAMLERRPARIVTVAAANRTARIAWAIMTRGGSYQKPLAAAA